MGQVQSPSPTALVVEDEPLQSAAACTLLEEADFAVVECQSAEAALVVLRERSDDVALVFTDVGLAGTMDGVELATIVRERHPRTAVVVTSGNIGSASKLPADVQFMPKPWLPLDLLAVAERARAG